MAIVVLTCSVAASNGGVEFVMLTLWDSMEAIQKFVGEDTAGAVVEPEAQSVLSGFDDFVSQFKVVRDTTASAD